VPSEVVVKTLCSASSIRTDYARFVIAEAGVNHDGADAVKFQTFRPEELVAGDAAPRLTSAGAAPRRSSRCSRR
jgi:sialic acid synthase SpsE